MTAAEHLAIAENLLHGSGDPVADKWELIDLAMSVNGLAHAVIAVAIELGVPHADTAGTGAGHGSNT